MKEVKTRKPYVKPQIQRVKLEVEEAVLQACKSNPGSAGKNKHSCGFPACKLTYGS